MYPLIYSYFVNFMTDLFTCFSHTFDECVKDKDVPVSHSLIDPKIVQKINEILQAQINNCNLISEEFNSPLSPSHKIAIEKYFEENLVSPIDDTSISYFDTEIIKSLFLYWKLYVDVIRCASFYNIKLVYKLMCAYVAYQVNKSDKLTSLDMFDENDRDIYTECVSFLSLDFVLTNFEPHRLNKIQNFYWKQQCNEMVKEKDDIYQWWHLTFLENRETIFNRWIKKASIMYSDIITYIDKIPIIDEQKVCESYFGLYVLKQMGTTLRYDNRSIWKTYFDYPNQVLQYYVDNANNFRDKIELENLSIIPFDVVILYSSLMKGTDEEIKANRDHTKKVMNWLIPCLKKAKQINLDNQTDPDSLLATRLKIKTGKINSFTHIDEFLKMNLPNLEHLKIFTDNETITIDCDNFVNLQVIDIIAYNVRPKIVLKATTTHSLSELNLQLNKSSVTNFLKYPKKTIEGNFSCL